MKLFPKKALENKQTPPQKKLIQGWNYVVALINMNIGNSCQNYKYFPKVINTQVINIKLRPENKYTLRGWKKKGGCTLYSTVLISE